MFNCQICTDILALEKETEGLLDEITGKVKSEPCSIRKRNLCATVSTIL